MALKLDNLIASVDALPLSFDERRKSAAGTPGKAQPRAEPAAEGFWPRIGNEVWSELKQLVSVSRIDQPDPVLLTPGQSK